MKIDLNESLERLYFKEAAIQKYCPNDDIIEWADDYDEFTDDWADEYSEFYIGFKDLPKKIQKQIADIGGYSIHDIDPESFLTFAKDFSDTESFPFLVIIDTAPIDEMYLDEVEQLFDLSEINNKFIAHRLKNKNEI